MSVSEAVRTLVLYLGDLSATQAVLAANAARLAEVLDSERTDSKAVAGISKELRETVAQLAGTDDDDEFLSFVSTLSAEVRH